MNHDAARATLWHVTPCGMRSEPYMAYGPRAFLKQYALRETAPLSRNSDTMQTFVCQIEWPDWPHIGFELGQGVVTQTYDLVKLLVDRLRCDKGWQVEAAYSDTSPPHKGGNSVAQRLFTMEVRCDFRDPLPGEEDPIEFIKKVMQQAGRHIYSSASLIGDRVKPTIVIYSHDWFKGHLDIPLFDDDIARGNVAITEAENVLAPEANVLTGVHLALIPPPAPPTTHPTVIEHEPVTEPVSQGLFSDAMLASLK